jgi:truncated hemoglobin YjbI
MSGLGAVNLKTIRDAVDRLYSDRPLSELFYEIYRRFSEDPLIGFFFQGKDLKHIAHQQQCFFERAIGLRDSYTGKSPAMAHRQLPPILEGHFNRRLIILGELLAEKGFQENEVEAWIRFEEAFRKAIVQS